MLNEMTNLQAVLSPLDPAISPKPALITPGEGSISHADLRSRSTLLGSWLNEQGVAPGELVGVSCAKSSASVIAILAIIASDSAYVPVDAHGSVGRNASIFEDCRTPFILADSNHVDELTEHLACSTEEVQVPDLALTLIVCTWPGERERGQFSDLAMILYTSGSTGRPKGVQLTHENVLAFVTWCARTFPVDASDIIASVAPFHFDLSIFDLYVGLTRGASILLLDQRTCRNFILLSYYLEKYEVSVCYSTPTVFKMILQYGRLHKLDHRRLKLVLFAGEVFPISPLRELKSYWPQAQFHNLYGPTESNVITYYPVPETIDESRQHPLPVGRPCDYADCRVLIREQLLDIDRAAQKQVEGELVVCGASVTKGYINKDSENQRAFMEYEGRNYYRTGDIVRVDPDGNIVYIRRNDRMVKRRGYRIELSEIERVMSLHKAVMEIAVLAETEADEVVIRAYVSTPPGETRPNVLELQEFLQDYLPSYFFPDKVHFLKSLPMTSTDKIDYQQLARLSVE
jgi:amino acid adenylation domain-containing protein